VASVDQTRAGFFPTVSASAGLTRSANATNGLKLPPATVDQAAISASWVPDLWGSVRRSLEAAHANEASSAADLANAVLSLQSALATDYFSLRVADEQQRLLEEAVLAYQRSLDLTESRYRGGVAQQSDVAQAKAQLEATKAQAIDVGIGRGQMEHAIAVLLGKAPEDFSLPRRAFDLIVPAVPAQLPASLLQRRPDVASAERLAAAANAQIGIAQAAYFPTLTLSATGGYRAPSGADLLTAPYRYWSLGPSLAETLFDAGARGAIKQQAIAGYDAAAATYRKSVLSALQNVEDELLALRLLAQETTVEDAAVAAAEETLRLTTNQYKAGTVSYLNVIIAQTTALNDRVTALNIRGRQVAASVQLFTGLGGDWNVDTAVAPRAATP
jgi:NodT family efflux transporter outer membrane factor (OMF) lipoprotein